MRRNARILALACVGLLAATSARAQAPGNRSGDAIPRDVREMYDRGLQYLASSQTNAGDWGNASYENGPGVTGLGVMAFLASGEDPNYGLYSNNIRRALRNIIAAQDANTGIMGSSMYHHGFAMLSLAEAYGAVDERTLWAEGGQEKNKRSIGQALELAVRAAITSQKNNPYDAWRYSPSGRDADTSVSGSVLVGLLAARNAGIEVPDEVIEKAIGYFQKMTVGGGQVNYSGIGGLGESHARSAIATLVYAIARRKDLPEFKSTLSYIKDNMEGTQPSYPEYTRYYQAQAFFQGDVEAWKKWNTMLVRQLKQAQKPDGSIPGQFGPSLGTSMSLLALALNYKFLPIYER